MIFNEPYSLFAYKPPTNENEHQYMMIVAKRSFFSLIFFLLSVRFPAIENFVYCVAHHSSSLIVSFL